MIGNLISENEHNTNKTNNLFQAYLSPNLVHAVWWPLAHCGVGGLIPSLVKMWMDNPVNVFAVLKEISTTTDGGGWCYRA